MWVLSLLPAAFVLVMGYAESVLLVCALGCFLALRPPAADRAPPTPTPTPPPPPARTSPPPASSPSPPR